MLQGRRDSNTIFNVFNNRVGWLIIVMPGYWFGFEGEFLVCAKFETKKNLYGKNVLENLQFFF